MVWLALAGAFIFSVWAVRRMHGSTIYFSHPLGFTAFGGGELLSLVPKDRYERILQEFIRAELFDSLHVTLRNDTHSGIALGHQDDQVEMSASFLRLKEPDRVTAFRHGMKDMGYTTADEQAWNVGLGEDSESLTLSYRCAVDLGQAQGMVQRALELLEGRYSDDFFVYAWRTQDGPSKVGVKVVPRSDILAHVP